MSTSQIISYDIGMFQYLYRNCLHVFDTTLGEILLSNSMKKIYRTINRSFSSWKNINRFVISSDFFRSVCFSAFIFSSRIQNECIQYTVNVKTLNDNNRGN